MSQHTPSLSFEVFPPNPEVGNAKLLRALANMQELAPHFISVTASNNKYNIKETTVALANYIQNELSIPTIAHLPAVYLSKEKVADTLHELDEVGGSSDFGSAWGYYPWCGTFKRLSLCNGSD